MDFWIFIFLWNFWIFGFFDFKGLLDFKGFFGFLWIFDMGILQKKLFTLAKDLTPSIEKIL